MRRLALACLLLFAVGCDRVPIGEDPGGSSLLLVTPDLSEVRIESKLELRLVPNTAGSGLSVAIGGLDIPFDSTQSAFVAERTLDIGLNTILVTVSNAAGPVETDTLYAVYLPILEQPLVDANTGTPRAEAAVAARPGGGALISGGRNTAGVALATADIVLPEPSRVQVFPASLREARAGHSATPILGGTLLLGGANGPVSSGASAFVRSPEWVGAGGDARRVEVIGDEDGPMRVGHVTRALTSEGETYLYVMGGFVPAGTGVTVSSTFDVYRIVGEGGFSFELERLSPPGGISGFVGLSNPALLVTSPTTASVFDLDGDGGSYSLRWSAPGTATVPFSLRVTPAQALRTPRTGAQAVDLGGGVGAVFGGRSADGDPVGLIEVVVPEIDRVFRMPPQIQLRVPRSDHIATILNEGRIVVAGGRPASGSAITAFEAFRF